HQALEQKSLQQWEQSAATQKMKAMPAVDVRAACEELVQTVDVSVRGGNYFLTFHGVNRTVARLPLTSIQMRQWLQIVYDQFLKAKWPVAVWPVWFDQQQVADKSLHSTVLH
ncbi:MAG: hypothetical protein U9R69_05940, partial [Thermodesulfobacteriota bacterium]|nr:hypothetical protein [Thermodesulfobacteriota bacterium]